MTVADLIKKLAAMPQDMRVLVDAHEADFDDPVLHEAWAIVGNNPYKDDGEYWIGNHADVSRHKKTERELEAAELVIIIGRR
jgi:hypothetical protein